MAKGNLFLGTARKKLGDVVFYRRDGVQQARVRVRTISNPQTEGQALQRSYLAPINKFYSPLAGVLETSWEGLNRLNSHNAFQSAAVRDARANGWYVPKAEGFFPLPYQLSKGILPNVQYSLDDSSDAYSLKIPLGFASSPAPTTMGQVSAAFKDRYGCQEGDQVTIIVVVVNMDGDYLPSWIRFFVDSSSTVAFDDVLRNAFFEPTTETSQLVLLSGDDSYNVVAGAVILSRYDNQRATWLRSSQWLAVADSVMSQVTGTEARSRAVRSYQKSTAVNTSDVYLNGSGAADFAWPVYGIVGDEPDAYITPVSLGFVNNVPFDRDGATGLMSNVPAVIGLDIANGRTVRAVIFSAADGQYLSSLNSWGDDTYIYNRVVIDFATDKLWQWLKTQGVTASDPT